MYRLKLVSSEGFWRANRADCHCYYMCAYWAKLSTSIRKHEITYTDIPSKWLNHKNFSCTKHDSSTVSMVVSCCIGSSLIFRLPPQKQGSRKNCRLLTSSSGGTNHCRMKSHVHDNFLQKIVNSKMNVQVQTTPQRLVQGSCRRVGVKPGLWTIILPATHTWGNVAVVTHSSVGILVRPIKRQESVKPRIVTKSENALNFADTAHIQ